jgi:hypothetical protein
LVDPRGRVDCLFNRPRQKSPPMCHTALLATKSFLLGIDEDLASETRARSCRRCGSRLHRDRYPRKRRGAPRNVGEGYRHRLSFTCLICDKRHTPASVRFLGRRLPGGYGGPCQGRAYWSDRPASEPTDGMDAGSGRGEAVGLRRWTGGLPFPALPREADCLAVYPDFAFSPISAASQPFLLRALSYIKDLSRERAESQQIYVDGRVPIIAIGHLIH